MHALNPSTQKAEAGRSLWILGQPQPKTKTLSQTNKNKQANKNLSSMSRKKNIFSVFWDKKS